MVTRHLKKEKLGKEYITSLIPFDVSPPLSSLLISGSTEREVDGLLIPDDKIALVDKQRSARLTVNSIARAAA